MATFQGLKQSSAEKQIFHLAWKIVDIFFKTSYMRWQVSSDCTCDAINNLTEKWALSHSEIFRTSKLMSFLLSFALTSWLVLPIICPNLAIAFLPLSISFPLLLWRHIVWCLFLQTLCYFHVWVFDDLWWCYRTWGTTTVFGWLFVNWI